MFSLLFGFTKSDEKLSWSIIFVILSLTLGISHPLTHFFLILNLLALYLIFNFFTSYKKRATRIFSNPTIVLFVITLLSLWLMINASGEFRQVSRSVRDAIQSFISNPKGESLVKYTAQPQYQLVNILRMSLGLVEIGFGYLLFFVLWFTSPRRRLESLTLLILLNSVMLIVPYSLYSGGWESLIERSFAFGLFFFPLTSSLFLSEKVHKMGILKTIRILFVCICLIACLLIPVTKYSVDPFEHYPSSFLNKQSFILHYVYENPPAIKMFEMIPDYIDSRTALDEKQTPLLTNSTLDINYLRRYDIVSFGSMGYNMFEIYHQRGVTYLANEVQIVGTYNRIYDLGESRIYSRSHPAQNK